MTTWRFALLVFIVSDVSRGFAQSCTYAIRRADYVQRAGVAMVVDTNRNSLIAIFSGGDTKLQLWENTDGVWTQRVTGASSTIAPSQRSGFAVAYDPTRQVTVLYGGGGQGFSDTWEWNGSFWTQRSVSGPGVRDGHAMVFDPLRGRIVLFGGQNGGALASSTFEYDGVAWTERAVAGPLPRRLHAMLFDPRSQSVVVFGGVRSEGGVTTYFDDTWSWDGQIWQQLASVGPNPRYTARMAYFAPSNQVLLFGGRDALFAYDDTWDWDGARWNFLPVEGPGPRTGHNLINDPSAPGLLVLGGVSGTSSSPPSPVAHDIWRWNGETWTLDPAPFSGMIDHIAADYDVARQVLVAFGGDAGGGPVADTHEWDGERWALRATLGPPARIGHTLTYAANRGRMVLFGGVAAGSLPGDTWEWDGTQWHEIETSSVPTPRRDHATVYDATRGVIVLYGGNGAAAGEMPLSDTWTYDGQSWTLAAPSGPPARSLHAMAYAADRQCVVLHGGHAGSTVFNDTWEWDGGWVQRSSAQQPLSRFDHSLHYDSVRGVCIAVGGSGPSATNTWEWDGTDWRDRQVVFNRANHVAVFWPSSDETLLLGGRDEGAATHNSLSMWQLSASHPQVNQQPFDLRARPGMPITLAASASGSGALSYEWRRSGTRLLNGTDYSDVETATLRIASMRGDLAGSYSVRVADTCSQVVSEPVTLVATCSGDFDLDGTVTLPDLANLLIYFGSSQVPPGSDGDVDVDGDVDLVDLATLLTEFGLNCDL